MPKGLIRVYGAGHRHFITTSCYRRRPLLGAPVRRDRVLRVLEEVRRRYQFRVIGFVIMPEHVHLLISEPRRGDPSVVMQVWKQRTARRILGRGRRPSHAGQSRLWPVESGRSPFWQKRFYDFNVFSGKKLEEKLRYMHNNPVQRGLVNEPGLWRWSSYRYYAFGEKGLVTLNE